LEKIFFSRGLLKNIGNNIKIKIGIDYKRTK